MNSRPRLCWKPARKRDRPDRVSLCAMRNIAATLLMAASLVAVVPVLALFLLVQKQLVEGLTAGAVK